jgi:four helix bundle protein
MASICNADLLKDRTKQFALQVIRLCRVLPRSQETSIITRQLLRSATSVGANYRAVCRARSTADFASKLGIVLEEADETLFWIELLIESGVVQIEKVASVRKEANELVVHLCSFTPDSEGLEICNLKSQICNCSSYNRTACQTSLR